MKDTKDTWTFQTKIAAKAFSLWVEDKWPGRVYSCRGIKVKIVYNGSDTGKQENSVADAAHTLGGTFSFT